MLSADYIDVFVPKQPIINFKQSHHLKYNEFLFKQSIKAEDLLFPTQVFDLNTLESISSESNSNYLLK